MHHGIMLKVKGDDIEEAKNHADHIMQGTIDDKRDIDWDYFQFIGLIDEAWLKEYRKEEKYKSVEDMVKHYIKLRNVELKYIEKQAKEELNKLNEIIKKTKTFPRWSMFSYYLRELDAIRSVIEYKDADCGLYTLHCTNNHYADLTDITTGDEVFYFWYDRHF